MKVYLESASAHYEGDFPSITIHYRPQERVEAERLKSLIEGGILDEIHSDGETERNNIGFRRQQKRSNSDY